MLNLKCKITVNLLLQRLTGLKPLSAFKIEKFKTISVVSVAVLTAVALNFAQYLGQFLSLLRDILDF
jgi:hypothetical protein